MKDNGHAMEKLADQLAEINELRRQLKESGRLLTEANNIITAIRDGEIDALLITENKKDQVYILQGADLVYREIIEDMQESYVTLSKDGVILFCNRNFAKMMHNRLDQVMGMSVYEFLSPSEAKIFRLSLAGKESFKQECSFVYDGGVAVPVLVSVNIRVEKEHFAYMIITDLTEQKRSEQRFMHRVFEQAGEAIIVCDMTGKIIRVNSMATQVFGEGLLQKLFDSTLQLCWERDGKPFSVQGALKRGDAKSVEAMHIGSDGRKRTFLVSAGWLTGADQGESIGFLVTLSEITLSKQAEGELKASKEIYRRLAEKLQAQHEELLARDEQLSQVNNKLAEKSEAVQQEKDRLTSLINSISDEVWFADSKKQLTLVNPAVTKEFILDTGVSDIVKIASNFEVLRADLTPRPVSEAPPLRALQGEIIRNEQEIVRTPANGELRTREVNANPVRNVDGNIIGSVSVVRDITERKAAEEALRRSAEIQTVMHEIANASLLSSSLDILYREIHRQVERILPADNFLINFLDEEAGEIFSPFCSDAVNIVPERRPIGKGLTEYIIGLGRAALLSAADMSRLRETGEYKLKKNQMIKVAHYLGAPLVNSEGKAFGVISMVTMDKTKKIQPEDVEVLSIIAAQVSLAIDRRRAEEALAESEVCFRTLVENAKDFIFSLTPDGFITYVSPNWIEELGHNTSDILGHSFTDFVHPEDHAACYTLMGQFCCSGERIDKGVEHRVQNKNGEWRWFITNGSAVCDSSGKIVSYIGIAHDITERKLAEDALKASQARYHALMDQSFEATELVDCKTREVVEVNRRFTEMLGYSLPEDAPLHAHNISVDSKGNLDRIFNTLLKQQRFLPPEARVFRHKNGTMVHVERAGTVINIEGRDYFLGTMRDMTAERARQADLSRDVEVARRVQQGLLPEIADSPMVDIRTFYYPSHFVSGDFYHLEWLNNGKLLRGFLIDISGHGLATALQTSSLNVLLREVMTSTVPLVEQMLWINRRAAKYFTEGSYAAMLGFELDFMESELRYVGAGITEFYANGTNTKFPGMFVGLWDDPEFTMNTLPIEPGDTLYFLTDGFTDALKLPENIGLLSTDGKAFDADVAALKQLAESEKLSDDATGICLKIQEFDRTQRPEVITKTPKLETFSEAPERLIQELRVRKIELEMQNVELRRIEEELRSTRDLYFEYYNSAPVGYLTLNEKELILESNLTMASMLGLERASLVGKPLTQFILPDDQDTYYLYRRQLGTTDAMRACELRLKKNGSDPFWVRIEVTGVRGDDDISLFRAVISDITECKRAEER